LSAAFHEEVSMTIRTAGVWSRLCTVLALCALATGAVAQSPQNVRIRGTVTAVEPGMLMLRTREGTPLRIRLVESTVVSTARAIALSDLGRDTFVGVTAVKAPDGTLVARGLHTLPKTAAEGHGAWDLEPGASMTNAYIAADAQVGDGREVTMAFKGGTVRVRVPPGTPVITADPATREALAPGRYLFMAARLDADDTLTALRITVEKDGVRPPQ
jgi:hypothetical protein